MMLLAFCIVSSCGKSASSDADDPEKVLLATAAAHIEKGEYEVAATIYTEFIEKHGNHPYIDDAAYRLAYLHVIADQANPYFNYTRATIFFEKFIENYPNSRYIKACTNWLHALNKINPSPVDPVVITVKDIADPAASLPMRDKIIQLEIENRELKKKLRELQDAIER